MPSFVRKKKILTLFLGWVGWFLGGEAKAQFTFATDNAGNSAYSDGWASGDNGGSGFGSWTISTTNAAAGVFIGNPANNGMGTTGIGTTAFGLFSSADQIQVYNSTAGSYDSYYLRGSGTEWRKVGTPTVVTSNNVATSGQAYFVSRKASDNNNYLVNPISP